jgi:hypothetical protein
MQKNYININFDETAKHGRSQSSLANIDRHVVV